jgi:hypothetical protein
VLTPSGSAKSVTERGETGATTGSALAGGAERG